MRSRIEVRLLGPFEVLSGGAAVALPGNKLRVLLTVLALSAGRHVPIETLGEAAWGSKPPGDLRATVQMYVARLRNAVGGPAIVTDRGMYRLDVEPDAVDALRLRRLSESATTPEEVAGALELWRGQPFGTLESEWLRETYTAGLTECHLTLLERRIDFDLQSGRTDELVAELTSLVDLHPLREPLWGRLILALERRGRRAEALERYETVRRKLAVQLGSDPGPELRQIHADLLAADTATTPTLNVPRQLPSDITGFTGRDHVLERLDRLLAADASAQPIVIEGAGGIGKTALAVHWAHRVRDRFPDGQLFVNLRGYGPGPPVRPATALDTLLRGIGVSGQRIPDGLEARQAMLRDRLAGKRTLLVLDNARDASHVHPLLPGSSCRVVVTSRNKLRGLGHQVALERLTPDESLAFLARRLQPGLAAYDESRLAELAELCGHLPLALAVAAVLAGDSGELVEELRDRRNRLGSLDIGDAATSPRVVFSWSYQALEPETARCFRLLSLHPGPDFDREAVAALTGTTAAEAAYVLERLADAHLVEPARAGRYQQHDLLHAYAGELSAGTTEAEDALVRLHEWYLHSAAAASRMLGYPPTLVPLGEPLGAVATFKDDDEATAWLDVERPALVSLVHDAALRGHHRTVYRIAQTLHLYLRYRYMLDDLLGIQRAAMTSAEHTGDVRAVAACAEDLGAIYRHLMDYDQALASIERALDLFGQIGDDRGRAGALSQLALVLLNTGQREAAADRLRESIAISHRLGSRDIEAAGLNNLGGTYVRLGRFDEAEDAARRALAIHHDRGNRFAEPFAIETLAQALAGQGRYREAIEQYQRAVDSFAAADDRWTECLTTVRLGIAQRECGLTDEARASWEHALAIYDDLAATDTADLRRTDILTLLTTLPT